MSSATSSPRRSRGRDEPIEIVERAEARLDGRVAARRSDRSPTGCRDRPAPASASCCVPCGTLADRMDGRQVDDVESHRGDVGQPRLRFAERAAARRIACRTSAETSRTRRRTARARGSTMHAQRAFVGRRRCDPAARPSVAASDVLRRDARDLRRVTASTSAIRAGDPPAMLLARARPASGRSVALSRLADRALNQLRAFEQLARRRPGPRRPSRRAPSATTRSDRPTLRPCTRSRRSRRPTNDASRIVVAAMSGTSDHRRRRGRAGHSAG